jgi:hypothetical protein
MLVSTPRKFRNALLLSCLLIECKRLYAQIKGGFLHNAVVD